MSFAYAKKAAAATTTTTPDEWPTGWTFPTGDGPWPPGWPLPAGAEALSGVGTLTVAVTLPTSINIGSSATVEAEVQEDAASSSAMDDHLLEVTASDSNGTVQLKKTAGGTFADAVYYQASNYTGSKYGISESIFFDFTNPDDDGETVTVTVTLISVEAEPNGTDTMTVTGSALLTNAALDGALDVLVAGDYAYVAANGALAVVDISDVSAPSLAGSVAHADLANGRTVTKIGTDVFVGAGSNIVKVDVSTPASPSRTATVTISGGHAQFVGTDGTDVLVAGNESSLTNVFFIYNTSLVLQGDDGLGTIREGRGVTSDGTNTAFSVHQTGVTGDAFLSLDISTPSSISVLDTVVSTFLDSATKLVYDSSRSLVYAASSQSPHVIVIDVSNTAAMSILDTITTSGTHDALHNSNVTFVGNNLYVAIPNSPDTERFVVTIDASTASALSETSTTGLAMSVDPTGIDKTDDDAALIIVGDGELEVLQL